MSNRKEDRWQRFLFIAITIINIFELIYFKATGTLTTAEFFIAQMVWFYGTILLIDNIFVDVDDDDDFK